MIFARIFKPVIFAMNWLGNLCARLLGCGEGGGAASYSPQELRLIVSASSQAGEIQQEEKALLENVLEFRDITVRNIMVNRMEMQAVAKGAFLRQVIELRQQCGHSRYPVFGESLDDILGFINVGDVLYMSDQLDTAKVEDIMKPVKFVPESMRVSTLFKLLKHEKIYQVVVVDEYGGTAGLATMEDVLEEIVGDIYTDAGDQDIVEDGAGGFIMQGAAKIDDAEEALGVDFKNSDYETVGGLICGQLGHIPLVGERVKLAGWLFEVTRSDPRAVRQLRITRLNADKA
jgi:CBS domain containing-hemolysin-like protein